MTMGSSIFPDVPTDLPAGVTFADVRRVAVALHGRSHGETAWDSADPTERCLYERDALVAIAALFKSAQLKSTETPTKTRIVEGAPE